MKSAPSVYVVPCNALTPSIVKTFDPMPETRAPIAFNKWHRSCTCGSLAAFVITVTPSARTEAISTFSVAVTDASSKKTSHPTSLFAEKVNTPSKRTCAPSAASARKCVSSLLRPITSPPGGGSTAFLPRARSGPAKRMEARTFCAASHGTSHVCN